MAMPPKSSRIELPRYVAFRAWSVLYRSLRASNPAGPGCLWGHWFSRITPKGAFRKVPLGGVVFVESNGEAEELIALIRAGKDLPEQFVQKLHAIDEPAGRVSAPVTRQGNVDVQKQKARA